MAKFSGSADNDESQLLPLMSAAQCGASETNEQLMIQLRAYFHLMAQNKLSPKVKKKVDHSDIVQNSCVRVVEGMQGFNGTSEGELRNWLMRILDNEVSQAGRGLATKKRDVHREIELHEENREGHKVGPQLVDSFMTPRTNAISEERSSAVHAAMARLPEEYAQIIKFRNWEQMSFREIANKMGKSVNAAEKMWYRAVQNLRKELGDLIE